MSKVEELRDDLDELIETEATKVLTANQFLKLPGFDKIMDAIVTAARSEGKAEGAEQERERARIAFEKLYGPVVEIHNIYGSDGNTSWICTAPAAQTENYAKAMAERDIPVLAPTKESEK